MQTQGSWGLPSNECTRTGLVSYLVVYDRSRASTTGTEENSKDLDRKWRSYNCRRATAFGGAGQGRVCQRWKCDLLQEWNSERICGQVLAVSES